MKINIKINLTGLPILLIVLFVGLKLTNVIAWSWLWVLCPLWFLPALYLVIFIIVFCVV